MGKMYDMLKTIKLLGGTGGTGSIDYDNLENLPTMNGNTIQGEMTSSDLGLASESDMQTEQAKTTGMSEGGSNYITVGGRRLYVDSNPPTGARPLDLWIGG